jgi:hypothetical protein
VLHGDEHGVAYPASPGGERSCPTAAAGASGALYYTDGHQSVYELSYRSSGDGAEKGSDDGDEALRPIEVEPEAGLDDLLDPEPAIRAP